MYATPRDEFSDEPVIILNTLIRIYSLNILADSHKLKNMLNDNDKDGGFQREIFLLTISLEANIPFTIIDWKFDFERLFYMLVRRLQEEFLIEEQAAQWAVYSWAKALEIVECSEEKKIDDTYSLIKSKDHYTNHYDKADFIMWNISLTRN